MNGLDWARDLDDELWEAYCSEDEEEEHGEECLCETCLQDYPERDILVGDGTFYDWE